MKIPSFNLHNTGSASFNQVSDSFFAKIHPSTLFNLQSSFKIQILNCCYSNGMSTSSRRRHYRQPSQPPQPQPLPQLPPQDQQPQPPHQLPPQHQQPQPPTQPPLPTQPQPQPPPLPQPPQPHHSHWIVDVIGLQLVETDNQFINLITPFNLSTCIPMSVSQPCLKQQLLFILVLVVVLFSSGFTRDNLSIVFV
ncbi:hypothetical protein P8452_56362 [Trifolium repens]|nr:hypothetical protein P8452_56362 [Trifolium repens]